MRLLPMLTLRLTVVKALVFAFWAVLFYFAIIAEINDATDSALEDRAEQIIRRKLAGETLPEATDEASGQYILRQVSDEYARRHGLIRYADREIWVETLGDYIEARTISYIFADGQGQRFEVVVFTPSIDKDDLKASIAAWLIVLYVALMVCVALVNVRTLRRAMAPFHAVLRWLDAYKPGHGAPPLATSSRVDEFRALATTVSRTVDRAESLYSQQRRFIANASHELQTPLAVVQNRLEMMLEEGPLTEQQMGEIVKTLRTLKSLTRTNRSLLLLSKIDNGQFTDTQPVDLAELLGHMLPDIQALYAHRRLEVSVERSTPFVVNIDPALADTLVGNLLRNAFVHADTGGRIAISVGNGRLTIANTGADQPLDASKIFQPFHHSPDKPSSTGLGLSIVEAICRLYSLRIDYAFESPMHVFSVTFSDQNAR